MLEIDQGLTRLGF